MTARKKQKRSESPHSDRLVHVLFDPVFSSTIGPSGIGFSRVLPVPCDVEQLPGVDVVCISHNHYDHMDVLSILQIFTFFPLVIFVVPLGNDLLLQSWGIPAASIVALDWYESHNVVISSLAEGSLGSPLSALKITCTSAQHGSGRTLLDQNQCLWAGFVVERVDPHAKIDGSIYFAGDTGYRRNEIVCPIFDEIAEIFGGFDLAFLPIWRGASLSGVGTALNAVNLRLSTSSSMHHASPADAMAIHRTVKSRCSVAIHFSCFGCQAETGDALGELEEALGTATGIWESNSATRGEGWFGVTKIGETVTVPIRARPDDAD